MRRPIIVTKIRPPRRRQQLLRRQRLLDLLSQHVDRKLILVCAPAGYGKTSLLVDYAQASAFPVCWLRLDERDGDPPVFLEYLVACIQQQFPGSCESTLVMVRTEGAWDIEALVGSLVNEISERIGEFFLLVFDDYHKLDQADHVNALVDTLLHYLPDNCQVIVSTRTLPKKLTLTRLAAEGHVVGIGQSHLRFTPEDIAALYAAAGPSELSMEECQRLFEATEGWPTAVALAGPSVLAHRPLPVGLTEPQALFHYLASEVLARQRPEVANFMLATSILESLSPELCDAVVGRQGSRSLLRELVEGNAFLWEIDADGEWYRYHQLLQEFLRAELGRRNDIDTRALHLRAAAWFASAGSVEPEIRHLLAAGDWRRAAERMESVAAEMLARGRYRTIVEWVTALPASQLRARPWLRYYLAAAKCFLGSLDEALAEYDAVIRASQGPKYGERRATALVGRAYALRLLGQLDDAMRDCREALTLAGQQHTRLAGEAHRSLGLCYYVLGDTQAAAQELHQALEAFEALGLASEAAATHTDLSAHYHNIGQIAQSALHAEAARRHWETTGNPGALARALNNLGTAYHAMGRYAEARNCLEEAIATARRAGIRRVESAATLSLADVEADSGQLDCAIELYVRGIELARAVGESWLVAYALAMGADALRLSGRQEAAAAWLDQARTTLPRPAPPYEEALLAHCQALLLLDRGQAKDAKRCLRRAVQLLGRMGYRREMIRSMMFLTAALLREGREPEAKQIARKVNAAMAESGFGPSLAVILKRLPEIAPLIDAQAMGAAASQSGASPEGPASGKRKRPLHARGEPRDSLSKLVVQAFGAPLVRRDGVRLRAADWQTSVARDLFFYLVDRPAGAHREELMTVFWPDSSYLRARSALHSTLYRLRRAVGRETVEVEDERYRVSAQVQIWYDVQLFVRLLNAVRSSDASDEALRNLVQALRLVRGPYLEGASAEWVQTRRDELQAKVITAGMLLAQLRERRGEIQEALATYRRILGWEPWREDAHRGVMRCYARIGARNLALRHYDELREAVHRELGTSPEPETTSLSDAIREGRVV